jgi:hypothetical protein
MADAAAFFAKKKKGKKFKSFNANKIDVASVTQTVHVDDVAAADEVAATGKAMGEIKVENDQWADTTTAWGGSSNNATSGGDSKVAELMDMNALNQLRSTEDDVAERLRIEETKAQLARAKEGMAKEAERLAAEKEAKEQKAAARAAGVAASSTGGGGLGGIGGKWVPSHMRSGGSAIRGPASMDGAGLMNKPNVTDEELFPDLAAADKILAEKEQKEKASVAGSGGGIRAPSGWGNRGGAAAASPAQRKPLNLSTPAERKPLNLVSAKKEEEAVAPAPAHVEETEIMEESKPTISAPVEEKPVAATAATTSSSDAAAAPEKKIVLKKKKKKDLSTFKAK